MRTYCLLFTVDPGLIDSRTLLITVVSYCLVFLVLAILGFIFAQSYRLSRLAGRLRRKKTPVAEPPAEVDVTGAENAAICTALYLYFTELHDDEKHVMTVKKISRIYSPWSSKIYGVHRDLK
jgi:hypothetical protein